MGTDGQMKGDDRKDGKSGIMMIYRENIHLGI